MTLRERKKVARALHKIVKAEFENAAWSRIVLRQRLRCLAAQAHQQGLTPEDLLGRNGRDAFIMIARAIAGRHSTPLALAAEWRLVVALVDPEYSIVEKELIA